MIAYTETADMSYFNPAAMSFSNKNRISGSHMKWKPNFVADFYHEFIAFNYKINDKYTIGGNFIYFNIGEQIGRDEQGRLTNIGQANDAASKAHCRRLQVQPLPARRSWIPAAW